MTTLSNTRTAYCHSSSQIDRKVMELRHLSLMEIASEILDREIQFDECEARLRDALERLAALEQAA